MGEGAMMFSYSVNLMSRCLKRNISRHTYSMIIAHSYITGS